MELRVKSAILVFAGISIFMGYGLITHEDTAISRFDSWEINTPYRVVVSYPQHLPVNPTGKLGAFYVCMKTFPLVGERWITTPTADVDEQLEIVLADQTQVKLGVNAVEASTFSFDLFSHDGKIVDHSDRYAINCDIRLLDKQESDMHCEDKLIGNSIRPVCTYRPSAGGG